MCDGATGIKLAFANSVNYNQHIMMMKYVYN